jgi:hypothetical protein
MHEHRREREPRKVPRLKIISLGWWQGARALVVPADATPEEIEEAVERDRREQERER